MYRTVFRYGPSRRIPTHRLPTRRPVVRRGQVVEARAVRRPHAYIVPGIRLVDEQGGGPTIEIGHSYAVTIGAVGIVVVHVRKPLTVGMPLQACLQPNFLRSRKPARLSTRCGDHEDLVSHVGASITEGGEVLPVRRPFHLVRCPPPHVRDLVRRAPFSGCDVHPVLRGEG